MMITDRPASVELRGTISCVFVRNLIKFDAWIGLSAIWKADFLDIRIFFVYTDKSAELCVEI